VSRRRPLPARPAPPRQCLCARRYAPPVRAVRRASLLQCRALLASVSHPRARHADATTYRATRDAYLKAANELKLATGPYKAARDAYVAATATYTKSLYE
jgi:hypothetical protein